MRILTTIGMAELVDKSLRPLRLPHYSFPVILTDGTGQLVVVHSGSVFANSPKTCNSNAIFDLEDSSALIKPSDARTVLLSGFEKFLQKLP